MLKQEAKETSYNHTHSQNTSNTSIGGHKLTVIVLISQLTIFEMLFLFFATLPKGVPSPDRFAEQTIDYFLVTLWGTCPKQSERGDHE